MSNVININEFKTDDEYMAEPEFCIESALAIAASAMKDVLEASKKMPQLFSNSCCEELDAISKSSSEALQTLSNRILTQYEIRE